MMLCEKGNFLCSFFILLTQWHEFPAQKLTNFHIFIIPLTVHININYETGCIETFSEKTQREDHLSS